MNSAGDLGGRDFLEVQLREAIEEGLAFGPHLVVATRRTTNAGGHCWHMGGEADDAEGIRRVARENLRAGADCLKVMATGVHHDTGGPAHLARPVWRRANQSRRRRSGGAGPPPWQPKRSGSAK